MRLIVTGATGLLGLNLSLTAAAQGHAVTGLAHTRQLNGIPFTLKNVDLLNMDRALAMMTALEPEAVIHCAAIANLGVAENNPDLAYQVNAAVPGRLAKWAAEAGIPFVHISTDAVFDGAVGGYREDDSTHPLSVYAQTKLAGEEAVGDANPDALIARVVFYGWSLSGKRSLSEFFFNQLKAGNRLKGFVDAIFCPLYVEDLAETLLEMLLHKLTGIYHVVSPESLSKYDFGVGIAQRFGFDPGLIEPVEMRSLDRDAPRALNLTLSTDKVQADLGHALPSIAEGIERLYQRWQEGYPAQLQTYGK